MRLLLLLLVLAGAGAEDVPFWVKSGIAFVETSSSYDGAELVWVNHKRGKAGEIGPFQMTRRAVREVYKGAFLDLLDETTSEWIFLDYIQMLHRRHHTWEAAVAHYNPGDPTYLSRVKRAAAKFRTAQ